ncbi:LysR substrate-binding domain-containing protein [Sphingomonas sanxanigenens]|uniref:HTH lysR-type domain-containing protein n=1 Tax=Sphingomonas sanxanigenens DSM 19645 = NX02 TaxID=1123269 RepID=W0A4X7_9SPHN|nr:LysR substrate-binding domain-containing protein [Sphingomonas sanxanigenens]AHE52086.1 hypothetical protein NX02_01620 [Sphingomonas sanxanigenens DSM 19645 = NX02]
MELRHLRYAICVADEMHFGRAAARLGISQPPLSQQIRALEEELGVTLFERTSRRVLLTEPGRLFVEEARKAVAQVEHAVDQARRAASGEIGTLAVGVVASAPLIETIASAFRAFRERHPRIRLALRELNLDDQMDALIGGQLDIAFVRGLDMPVLAEGLSARMLIEEDLIVALRDDHPLAERPLLGIADLADQPFVLYERALGAGFNDHIAKLCRAAGFTLNVIQETGGLATLLGLVSAGFGVTVIARSLAAIHIEGLAYRPLKDSDAISRLWIVTHDSPSVCCRRFLDILEGCSARKLARQTALAS